MIPTDYQAQYFSLQLTRRRASDDSEKLSTALINAQVDLNPHQVEAALFAFNSPLSRGAVLADEVGLGKTIEAGILLSQFWASGQKRLVIICPSNLRKQWAQELEEKFFLPSLILEGKRFKEMQASGNYNPFEAKKVIICSFHFAKTRADFLEFVKWDLVVIDEAHRLRNAYKPSNVIGNAIRNAIYPYKKVLLTATPLQNSLMELYGLVSIVDEHVFGNVESFRAQFTRVDDGMRYQDLKDRLTPVVKRTLRKQVREYIRYTERIPITVQFEPTKEEQELYEQVSDYLQRDLLYALPFGQRHLITLVVRKLLASSTYAITATLEGLIRRLEKILNENKRIEISEEDLLSDLDHLDELLDEWDEDAIEVASEDKLSLAELDAIKEELDELKKFRELSVSIVHNAKGEKLFTALEQGFLKLTEIGANKKAIIFTESRRTQEYLFKSLEENGYKGKVMLFNGTNNDERSKQIYKSYKAKHEGSDKLSGSKTADMRQALVDYFKGKAEIMIATEAAAEGINLQFCSMIVNYDLPWNPQRVEQRIGRCHRYGQLHDVVVVNFLNMGNAADRRVFELLDEKFNLFKGVFGASDDVLGALESGLDFEKKIAEIYATCRSTDDINNAFDGLQKEFEHVIEEKMKKAQSKLMENFDAEVIDKLRIRMKESKAMLTRFERWLWWITQAYLQKNASFDTTKLRFKLTSNPFSFNVKLGNYSLDKKDEYAYRYRLNHPLANGILKHFCALELSSANLTFNLSSSKIKVAMLKDYVKSSGWLSLSSIEVNSFEVTDHLLLTAMTDDGRKLTQEQAARLFDLPSHIDEELPKLPEKELAKVKEELLQGLRLDLKNRDAQHLQHEANKLNRWAEDRVYLLEKQLKDTKQRIRTLNNEASNTSEPLDQLDIQKKIRELEKRQRKQRQEIFDAEDRIKDHRDNMIEEMAQRIQRSFKEKQIFTVRWNLI